MGDINRYYVPPKPTSQTGEGETNGEKKKTVIDLTGSLSRFTRPKVKLPTPQAFFERQQRAKDAERQAMMRFASRRTVKHNLRIRYDDLRNAREDMVDELNVKLVGKKPSKNIREKTNQIESEQEYLERKQASKAQKAVRDQDRLQPGINGFYLNELEDALEDDNEYNINKSILVSFFEQYAPKKVGDVDKLLQEYKGNEFMLFKNLATKYKIDVTKSSGNKVDTNYTSNPTPSPRQTNGGYAKQKTLAREQTARKTSDLASTYTDYVLETEKYEGETEEERGNFKDNGSVRSSMKLTKQNSAPRKEKSPKSDAGSSSNGKSVGPVPIPMSPQMSKPVNLFKQRSLPDVETIRSSNVSSTASEAAENKRRTAAISAKNQRSYGGTRVRSFSSLISDKTVNSLGTQEPVTEEMKQFQEALDEEIKGKLYSGEYVLSIMEHGGRWWVNRDTPKVHPSQRRRNTMLEELRKGKVPIANEKLNANFQASKQAAEAAFQKDV